MAEITYSWPARDKTQAIGKRVKRLDGPEKATGAAKYTYDINLKNQLIARALGCPHAHTKIKSVNVDAAKAVPGVAHVEVLFPKDFDKTGWTIQWQGELIAVVAAESEAAAREGVAAVKVEYEPLEVFVLESDVEAAEKAGRTAKGGGKSLTQKEPGDNDDEDEFVAKEIERLLKESAHTVEGSYGIDAITHCCLEPHGSTVEW